MRICLALAALAAVIVATPSLAIQRTFVASNGNDGNPCTLVAPCRSFTAALLKTTGFGEIIVLDSAGYGPVTIAKSVSIIAPQGIYAGVTVPSGDGITVNALPAIVTLRGLTINGQGTGGIGINIKSATRVNVESCVISNMSSNGILLTGAPSAQLTVLDTVVRSNGGTGIGIAADASVVVDHVRSEQNACDGFYIAPGATFARASITDSIFAWNGCNGISINSITGADTNVGVERSTMTENGGSGMSAIGPGHGEITVGRSAFVRNVGAAVSVNSTDGGELMIVVLEQNTLATGLGSGTTGIRADGSGGSVWVSGNATAQNGGSGLLQVGLSGLFTYGDNVGPISTSGVISKVTGK